MLADLVHTAAYGEKHVLWALFRNTDKKESGSYSRFRQVDWLSEDVDEQAVLAELAMPDAFPMEYEPLQGDGLYIRLEYVLNEVRSMRRPGTGGFMYFGFDGTSWTAGVPMDEYEAVCIAEGVIEVMRGDDPEVRGVKVNQN